MSKQDEAWKEYWRKNNPTIQRMRRESRNRKIRIIVFVLFIVWIITGVPQGVVTKYKINKHLTLSDHTFIDTVDELGKYCDSISLSNKKKTFNPNVVNDYIEGMKHLNVSTYLYDYYIDVIHTLNQINPINTHASFKEFDKQFREIRSNFIPELMKIFDENAIEYRVTTNGIEYTYKYRDTSNFFNKILHE